ncbi:MAG: UDP-N-acetylmuramate dehydrogenase [Opitutales bacterium]|nr:UDP-N-acetylmuramate dehydrogenase [Opitutales bacterium]
MPPLPPGNVRSGVPLAPFTTWRIGGPAQYLAEPGLDEIPALLAWAQSAALPVWVIGRGSNILIDDAGLPGLVLLLRNTLQDVRREGDFLVTGAGVSLPRLAKAAAAEGYAGFEFFIGIPGTVGGAVFMNAGFGPGDPRDTKALLHSVDLILPDGSRETRAAEALHLAYRKSDLQLIPDGAERPLVVGACFVLSQPGDQATIRDETRRHLQERKEKQPLTRPTAGSVFRASDGIPAAIHIQQAGLKGHRIGDAMVSLKHANWIENVGHATASDVRRLIADIIDTVHFRAGIHLFPEVRILPP